MRKPSVATLLLVWILCSACETPRSDTAQTPAPSSSRVVGVRAPHERVDNLIRKEDTVLLVSFFNGKVDVAQHASLSRERLLTHTRRVDSWTMHGSPTPVPAEKFESARAKLAGLPESDSSQLEQNAFFVSWQTDGSWITRTYDQNRLPPAVRQLLSDLDISDSWLSGK